MVKKKTLRSEILKVLCPGLVSGKKLKIVTS